MSQIDLSCQKANGRFWGLRMYRLAIVGAGLLSIAGFVNTVSAADLPAQIYTKAPPPAAVYNWTGFYAGLHVGGDYVSVTTSAVGANSSGSSQANQFLGGVLGGYNWQTGPWVFGVEGDWSSIANARNPDQITTLEASYLASAKSSRRSNEPLVQWPVVVLKRGSLIILACGLKVCTSTAEPSVTIFPRPFSTAVSYPQGRTTTSVNTRSTERA